MLEFLLFDLFSIEKVGHKCPSTPQITTGDTFMIPIILGAIALGTALGAAKGSEGIGNVNKAKEIRESAQAEYESAVSQLKVDWENTNNLAKVYGQLQLDIRASTIRRFVAFTERIGQQACQGDMKFLRSLKGISVQQIKEYKSAIIEAEQLSQDIFSAAATGTVAGEHPTYAKGWLGKESIEIRSTMSKDLRHIFAFPLCT